MSIFSNFLQRLKNKSNFAGFAFLLVGMTLLGTQFLSASAQNQTFSIGVQNNFFDPTDLTLEAGDSIMWLNNSGFHDVVSTSGPESFSSGNPGVGWTFTRQFNVPGNYTYVCTIHSGMEGSLTVLPASQPTDTPIASMTATLSATATMIMTGTAIPTGTPVISATATPVIEEFLLYLPKVGAVERFRRWLSPLDE